MKKKLFFILVSFTLATSCNSYNVNSNFDEFLQANTKQNDTITQKIVLDNPAFYNSGNELSVFAILDDKKNYKISDQKNWL
ncbi:MAG: hypothetical protein KatS3mg068_2533 [Candidatus Sericytochromatia bacterium]|nr:MAG: hypothetical protein KatS3mg068_2533 [Candidatus Sericytochromatia bacterium]